MRCGERVWRTIVLYGMFVYLPSSEINTDTYCHETTWTHPHRFTGKRRLRGEGTGAEPRWGNNTDTPNGGRRQRLLHASRICRPQGWPLVASLMISRSITNSPIFCLRRLMSRSCWASASSVRERKACSVPDSKRCFHSSIWPPLSHVSGQLRRQMCHHGAYLTPELHGVWQSSA